MISKDERKSIEVEWSKYKYCIMERSYKFYRDISSNLSTNECSYMQFIEKINSYMEIQPDKSQVLNTIYHVWGYFKKISTDSEKAEIFNLIDKYKSNQCSLIEIKSLLHKYAVKYDVSYLLNSYYFSK